MKDFNSRMIYFLIGCISFAVIVMGATYAYFTASDTDESTVKGRSESVTFGLSVDKVTTVDMAFGLIPMRNDEASYAASHKCKDILGNAGCQMYKITVSADSDMVMFLDGYIVVTPNESLVEENGEILETRFTEIYTDDNGENFYTRFTADTYNSPNFIESDHIKTGQRVSDIDTALNRRDDFNCLFVSDKKIGGDAGRELIFYVMLWVYDNGKSQDYLQGMELAYRGEVIFVTAEGNELSASFD